VLPTTRYSDQRPGVRYGARGESLLVNFHQWELWRWDWRHADELVPCAGEEFGPEPWRHLLACLFVPGGEAFLRANGFWPEDQDLPPPVTDPHRLDKHAAFGPDIGFTPYAFRPDGRAFLYWRSSFNADSQILLSTLAGRRLVTLDLPGRLPYGDCCFSPDGFLLAVRGWSRTVYLFENPSGKLVGELEHKREVRRIAFSPRDPLLATSADRTVRLWDAANRQCLHQFRSFRRSVESLAFSRDGRLLAAGAREGHVRLWDVATGRQLAGYDWGQGEVYDLAFAPDGLTAAAACARAIVVWDLDV
jgi:WD40 repeat protein